MTAEEFEYLLGKTGAIKTEITSDPTPQVKDVMMSALGNSESRVGTTVSKNLKKFNFFLGKHALYLPQKGISDFFFSNGAVPKGLA